jgi:hypothetical protein
MPFCDLLCTTVARMGAVSHLVVSGNKELLSVKMLTAQNAHLQFRNEKVRGSNPLSSTKEGWPRLGTQAGAILVNTDPSSRIALPLPSKAWDKTGESLTPP